MGPKLRVLSANLWNGRALPDAFAELVSAMDVDVVAVQECTPEQAEALCQVMPYGLIQPSYVGGMGIALKRPGDVERVELPKRPAYCVQLTPENWPGLGQSVEIVNVHFAAPHIFRPKMPSAIKRT